MRGSGACWRRMTFLAMERDERPRLRRLSRSTRERPPRLRGASGQATAGVHKWRARWVACPSVESLEDADRSGRPPSISVATKCELVKLACDRPPKVTFAEVWTQQALSDALRRQTGRRVSRSTVQRVLSAEGLRPHRVRFEGKQRDPGRVRARYELASRASHRVTRVTWLRDALAGREDDLRVRQNRGGGRKRSRCGFLRSRVRASWSSHWLCPRSASVTTMESHPHSASRRRCWASRTN